MKYPLEVLLAGRSKLELEALRQLLDRQSGIKVTTRLINNGHVDPLYNVAPLPDTLIYMVSDLWAEELAALGSRPSSERPPTLVVGPTGDFTQFRMAMQAGARDFFTLPVSEEDFTAALERISRDLKAEPNRETANLTVVINAKGGSGASVVATNIAHMHALDQGRRTVLVDLDLQFGAVPVYLNLTPNNGLLKAFHEVEKLDGLAIEGLVLKHQGGLRVLATSPDELMMPQEVPGSRVAALFELLADSYDEIVVDMPRHIDSVTSLVLQHADRIVVMMEASLAHVRDANRLLQILHQVLGIAEDRVKIVVNRYDKKGSLQRSDIQNTLGQHDVETLPSDFRRVNESVNLGSPLYDMARGAPLTKHLLKLTRVLSAAGVDDTHPVRRGRGLFGWVRT
jgi:pilus assembly protein CpaE